VIPDNKQVEFTFHVAVGIAPPSKACSYVPPEAKDKLAVDEVIVPDVPPALSSFLIVPVTVVRLLVAL
jgi:hypothetical protein